MALKRVFARWLLVAIVGSALAPTTALAFDFIPAPAEWATWPDFCRARYASLPLAQRTPYAGNVPPATIESWRSRLGQPTFDPLHHYCASLVYLQRYYVARTDQERRHLLYVAKDDCAYTLRALPPTSPLYRPVAGHMRLIQSMQATLPPAPR